MSKHYQDEIDAAKNALDEWPAWMKVNRGMKTNIKAMAEQIKKNYEAQPDYAENKIENVSYELATALLRVMEQQENSYVQNCYIRPKEDDGPLFNGDDYMVRLDGYAIIPKELWQRVMGDAEAMSTAIKRVADPKFGKAIRCHFTEYMITGNDKYLMQQALESHNKLMEELGGE